MYKPAARETPVETKDQHHVLQLFVAGAAPNSLRAIQNVRLICEEQLPGRYELAVIDIYQHTGQLAPGQVLVVPTLMRQSPLPVRVWTGELTNHNRVLEGLDDHFPLGPSSPESPAAICQACCRHHTHGTAPKAPANRARS